MWRGLPIETYHEEYRRFRKDAFFICGFLGVVFLGVGLLLFLTLL